MSCRIQAVGRLSICGICGKRAAVPCASQLDPAARLAECQVVERDPAGNPLKRVHDGVETFFTLIDIRQVSKLFPPPEKFGHLRVIEGGKDPFQTPPAPGAYGDLSKVPPGEIPVGCTSFSTVPVEKK